MGLFDAVALAIFAAAWLFYEPILKRVSRRAGVINTNMTVVRLAWMANMTRRENRFLDSQLLGHALNSASFFASANLIIIAAAAGALFGGETTYDSVVGVALLAQGPRWLFEVKLALITLTLSRGLLDFIWSIRQMNYCLAVIGATPEQAPRAQMKAYAEAAASLLNPALSSFNAGVRGYYFALAGSAWLLGAAPFICVTLGAMWLLVWRQSKSETAGGVDAIRNLLDQREAAGEEPPSPRITD